MRKKLNRALSLCLTLLLLIGALPFAASAAGVLHWGGTYMSPDNNTVTTAPLPVTPDKVELAWSKPVGNSTVVILGEYVYTYNSNRVVGDQKLYMLDKDTGETVKSVSVGRNSNNVYSYICSDGEWLYVSIPTAVIAFDQNLTQRWKFERSPASPTGDDYCPVQYINGYVVSNGLVLDAETGVKKLTLTGTYNWSNGVEVDGYYYVAGSDGKLYSFDTTNWTLKSLCKFNGAGAGVMHYNGRVYWGDQQNKAIYSVGIENGSIDSDTLITGSTVYYTTYTTPVACNGRIYLAGTEALGDEGVGLAAVCAYDAITLEQERETLLSGSGHKIQSTPILYRATAGGSSTAGLGDVWFSDTLAVAQTTAYIYVQDYANPGKILVMSDDGEQKSGTFTELLTPAQGQYAWEQMACDNSGALYISTDAGYLMKYQTIQAAKPVLTGDMAVNKTYQCGQTAETLTVNASVRDGGALSYQWQRHDGDAKWYDIAGAEESYYTPSAETVGVSYYRCVVTNTRAGTTAQTESKVAKITVEQSRIPGDVNADTAVDGKDVTCLTRYLAGWQETDPAAENADVNGDSAVDVLDLILLRRYVARWNVQLQ